MALREFWEALSRRKVIPVELQKTKLNRCLTTFDLTFLGVGSTLGLSIYILVGQIASEKAGPAVCISYLIAAFASVFAALCYAEFGARVPQAGSAYVYSYVSVGEFVAFIIGWNLILEYVIGTASAARGYSGYIGSLFSESRAMHFNQTIPIHSDSFHSYVGLLAFGITVIVTVIVAMGVKDSTGFNNTCSAINLFVVTYAVITGSFKADWHNWNLLPSEIPSGYGKGGFAPYGFQGIMSAAGTAFYGYIGFDCIAATGEEAANPHRSVPIAIVSSLSIAFFAYFGISVVETLMWPYYDQNQSAPLPYVFEMVGWPVASWIITIGAFAGLSTSLFGTIFPLPRILYAMANDGLIFKFLANTHEKLKTPLIATVISGIFAGLMAVIFNLKDLADMMSIGTLLAYTLVAVSLLILRYRLQEEEIPPVSSFFSYDAASETLFTDGLPSKLESSALQQFTYDEVIAQLFNRDRIDKQTVLSSQISMMLIMLIGALIVLLDILLDVLQEDLLNLEYGALTAVGMIAFLLFVSVFALSKQPSDQEKLSFRAPCVPVVPVVSIFANFYLMLKLPTPTWYRFVFWMILGFMLYFGYGISHSSERVPPVTPASGEVVSKDNEKKPRTEHSPLLAKKS